MSNDELIVNHKSVHSVVVDAELLQTMLSRVRYNYNPITRRHMKFIMFCFRNNIASIISSVLSLPSLSMNAAVDNLFPITARQCTLTHL